MKTFTLLLLVAMAMAVFGAPSMERENEIETLLLREILQELLEPAPVEKSDKRALPREKWNEWTGLTDAEIDDYKQVFDYYDKDGSGTISMEEFKNALKPLQLSYYKNHYVEREFNSNNTDGEDGLSLIEFIFAMMNYGQTTVNVPYIREMKNFKQQDKDGNNSLSKEEFKQVALASGLYTDTEVNNSLTTMFDAADTNADRQISLDECINYFAPNDKAWK